MTLRMNPDEVLEEAGRLSWRNNTYAAQPLTPPDIGNADANGSLSGFIAMVHALPESLNRELDLVRRSITVAALDVIEADE